MQTLGLLSRRNTLAKEDAECIALAKKAGAIILATTNVPEVNKWQETRNNLIGQTNNPYDCRRTVGGSSGGEGALIASCASTFGIGTDIGGSIRMPGKFHLPIHKDMCLRLFKSKANTKPFLFYIQHSTVAFLDTSLPLAPLAQEVVHSELVKRFQQWLWPDQCVEMPKTFFRYSR